MRAAGHMPRTITQPAAPTQILLHAKTQEAASIDVGQLCELALEGLAPMFNVGANLFCHRRKRTAAGMVCEGVSHRYTAMSLLGLIEAERAGMRSPVPIEPVLKHLLENLSWVDGVGNMGLLLWLCAYSSPKNVRKLCSNLDLKSSLSRFSDAREGKTTEMAWFLAGLAHAALAVPENRSTFESVAVQAYEELKHNQRMGGIFAHLAQRRTFMAAVRGHIGCFADQAYPIYALTRFAEAFENETALDMARGCAEAICRLQGPQGQWWWHYNSSTAEVFGRYPVFSVHQHGMAPMALFAVSDACGGDLVASVYKGLQWIGGANELGCDLRQPSDGIVWRGINQEQRYQALLTSALGIRQSDETSPIAARLKLNGECRPYEFGWLLYAFAQRRGTPAPSAGKPTGTTLSC